MTNSENVNYVPGVACIVVQDGNIVFEKRAAGRDGAGLLDFCSGHIEIGETPDFTMRRELFEELAIPYEYSAKLIEVSRCKMHLEKRQKEKDWDMVFYYLEIPKSVTLIPQNEEVAVIKTAPFADGIKAIKNDATQFTYIQMIPFISQVEQLYARRHA
ncbi:MAG: NUDIX hydrolase [Candidatus Saccharimonadales bacterium]